MSWLQWANRNTEFELHRQTSSYQLVNLVDHHIDLIISYIVFRQNHYHLATFLLLIISFIIFYLRLFFSAHQLIGGQSSPQFIVEPPTKVHFSNSSGAVIPCTATGYPSVKTWWVSSDESIVNDVPGLRHIRSTGELVLSPFSAQIYTQDVHSTVINIISSLINHYYYSLNHWCYWFIEIIDFLVNQ